MSVCGAARAGARHIRPLLISFVLIVAFLVVQVVVGIVTGSLALLSDAGHMATDAMGLGMAAAAIHAASRARAHPQRTFGLYRLEIVAALVNAVLLFAVAGYVAYEAIDRFTNARNVASAPVLIVGVIGLAVNGIAFVLLRDGAKESLNLQGAYLEVLSDTLGSVAVIVACDHLGDHRMGLGRPADRCRHRAVHPSKGVEAGPRGAASTHPGGARRSRPTDLAIRHRRDRRGRRCA